jgi:regulatory protein
MTITDISLQAKNKDRVNVSVDGRYRFSLDVFQVGELGLKVGKDYTDEELVELETESQFGKLYARALEYCMMRPHSVKEVRDYLWRKTRATRVRVQDTNEYRDKPGVSQELADRVLQRLINKEYVNDQSFTKYWMENRKLSKGVSRRKLTAELRSKGVDQTVIEENLQNITREENDEILKIIIKKYSKYDEKGLITYLARQGFSWDVIREGIKEFEDTQSD